MLDCYAGTGSIWAAIKKELPDRDIDIMPIEQEAGKLPEYGWEGNNVDALYSLKLDRFNVIDLDAYGVCCEQLNIVFNEKFSGVVFVTFIQSVAGRLPDKLLMDVGFPEQAIKQCPIMCSKRGWEHFKNWLAMHGVTEITHRSYARKHYLCFLCSGGQKHG